MRPLPNDCASCISSEGCPLALICRRTASTPDDAYRTVMSAFEGGKEGAEGKWSARTADAPCIKPLLWEPLGMRQFKAKAPLFGNIRIEKWGSKLNVLWSVPGLCASFIDGDFPDEDTAKAAAQTEFERRILEVVT